ncbi:MAG: DedA family protein [Pseudomonadota bacterium]
MLSGSATEAFAWIVEFTRENSDYIAPIVFAMGLGESLVFVSFFIPSTVLFLAIGAAHSAADGSFWHVWLAASAGAFIGDVISFCVGRYMKGGLARVWPFYRNPEILDRARITFRDWGGTSIIISKFMGAIRPVLPVAAGALEMRWGVFLPASVLSCLIWAGAFLGPGYGLQIFSWW